MKSVSNKFYLYCLFILPVLFLSSCKGFDFSRIDNRVPVAIGEELITAKNSPIQGELKAVDSDDDILIFLLVSAPQHGKVEIEDYLTGSFTYTPEPEFVGTDEFSFMVSDGLAASLPAEVSIRIEGEGDEVIVTALDGFVSTEENSGVKATLRYRSSETINHRFQIVKAPANGVLSEFDELAGTVTYQPRDDFEGTDGFTFQVIHDQELSNVAKVTISVKAVDEVPIDPPVKMAGIWISSIELKALPNSGVEYEYIKSQADNDEGTPDLSNQDQSNNVLVLAKALIYAKTREESYRQQVIKNVMAAMGTEEGGRTLALGRELAAYVVAADLVGMPSNEDEQFRQYLKKVIHKELSGKTLVSTHEDRPNNWGTMAGGSRAAVAVYLEDNAELERAAQVFKGYLGDRSAYAEFTYGSDLSWQADRDLPVGINPLGAIKDGVSIDGALPEEMRRGGSFKWPPSSTGYPWEALQGAFVQAEILYRAGYDVYEWEDRALLRAVKFLYEKTNWPAEGDDEWLPSLINYRYGTHYPTKADAHSGKIMGFTQYTHMK